MASTSSVDVKPIAFPIPLLNHPSTSSELSPSISRTSSFNSITDSPTVPPPVHHARTAPPPTSDTVCEAALSEKELRDLYDDEVIDHFLRFFSAVGCSSLGCKCVDSPPQQHVKEVKLNDGSLPNANVELSAAADGVVVEDPENSDDKDWVSLSGAGENLGLPRDGNQPQTISERIAQVGTFDPCSFNS